MPTNAILGFENKWYPIAFETAENYQLDDFIIKLIHPIYFLATKFDAYNNRGNGDILESKDIEDILNVINGRPQIYEELFEFKSKFKDNKVISTGYNGSVSGTEHCIDHECLVIEGHCVRTLHAEVNAILQGAERGVPKGFTAYVTHFPCLNCTKQLLQVGCKRVVYINQYRMDDYAQYLYQEKGTELTHLPLETVQAALKEADLM